MTNLMKEQPAIKKEFDFWRTYHPQCVNDFFDDYYNAVEIMEVAPKEAEKAFKKIIKACGNGHIDAITHLGILYNDTAKPIEGNALIIKAYKIAMEAFPADFRPGRDKLEWSFHENRPILRAIHCYGLELMKEESYEKAIEEFEFILRLNPNDNQGVRYLIADCLFHLDRPMDFLKLERRYSGEHSVEFVYGKLLSLYLVGEYDKAIKQLKIAKKTFPFVAEELVKAKHIFPANEFDKEYGKDGYGYPIGSRQQAFDYWRTTKEFWKKAKGITAFIEKNS